MPGEAIEGEPSMTFPDQSISGRRWRELLAREGRPWPVAIEDWERAARDTLDGGARGYVFGGAGSGSTRDANVQAFAQRRLAPHVLATPADRDLSVTLLGQTFPTPIFLAPVGVLTIVHPGGDLAAAAAARDLGMTYIVSTAGSEPMESVTAETPGLSAWYQLYWINSRELTASFVDRAKSSGYSALVVTVDTPMLGWRESDLANAYSPFSYGHGIGQFTSDPVFRSMLDFDPGREPGRAGQEMMKLFVNPGLTDLPILLKGVLRADDARRALDAGVSGLIVSNHGGRQVDGSVSALDALVAVRTVVPAAIPVLLDGGVRRGSDVIKAVALGSDAVLVGRPYVYGLAAGGRVGVHEVLSNLLAETDSVLALSGYRRLGELDCGALADQGPTQRGT
jgi:lactate 2-monooxygenase